MDCAFLAVEVPPSILLPPVSLPVPLLLLLFELAPTACSAPAAGIAAATAAAEEDELETDAAPVMECRIAARMVLLAASI
jgi:hypothetical protein